MKSNKNKRTNILLILLLCLLIFAYKIMFMDPNDSDIQYEAVQSELVIKTLQDLDSINFDTNVISDPKFNTLKSIEIPIPELPIGKKNPFSKSNN